MPPAGTIVYRLSHSSMVMKIIRWWSPVACSLASTSSALTASSSQWHQILWSLVSSVA
jgi:hypothetical protein